MLDMSDIRNRVDEDDDEDEEDGEDDEMVSGLQL